MIIIYFLLLMLPIVIVHELGHFYIGKWMGIKPEVFSIGFGPEIYSRTAKDGTKWRLAAIPAGGYVKFANDSQGTSFPNLDVSKPSYLASYYGKIATLLAGPFANFLLSFVLFFLYATSYGLQSEKVVIENLHYIESLLQKGDEIIEVEGKAIQYFDEFYLASESLGAEVNAKVKRGSEVIELSIPNPNLAVVTSLDPALPAFKSGIELGDRITHYGGVEVVTMRDLAMAVTQSAFATSDVVLIRDGKVMSFRLTPAEYLDGEDVIPRIGVGGGFYETEHAPLTLKNGALYAWRATFWIITKSYEGIVQLITGEVGVDAISSPVGIGRMAAESAGMGFWNFLSMMALVSSGIGFMNLLPLPVLDGGHIVLNTYEKLTGRLPPQAFMNILFALGFGLLIGLMSLTTLRDLFG